MNRRDFLTACSAGVFVPMLSRAGSEKHPNILFVFADQLRSMELGCYGGTRIETPNMDRLAREGVRFKHAISTYPVCSPFRAMLMSGNLPLKNGMVMNGYYMKNPSPYFAEVCKSSGYRTGYIGKWHIDGISGREGYIPPERRRGFDFWQALECTHQYFSSKYYNQDEKETRTWEGYDAVSQTANACSYIETHSGADPFCLFLSWGPPHSPYIAPKDYLERMDPQQIDLRGNVDDFAPAEKMRAECNTELPRAYKATRNKFAPKLDDRSNKDIRQWYQGYCSAIKVLDDCLGKLFQTLETQGILDDTIVVFTSDHGDNLGSHRQYGKQLPYEESISIPFLVRYPKKIQPGTVTDALLAPIDIMPTVLSLAGVPCHAVDGKDISGAATGHDEDMQDAVLLMRMFWSATNWITNGSGPWRGIRTKRYTYARKADSREPWMLFDNEKDPLQMNNLVDDPLCSDLVAKLDAKTSELLTAAEDPEKPGAIARRVVEESRQYPRAYTRAELLPRKIEPGSGFGIGNASNGKGTS